MVARDERASTRLALSGLLARGRFARDRVRLASRDASDCVLHTNHRYLPNHHRVCCISACWPDSCFQRNNYWAAYTYSYRVYFRREAYQLTTYGTRPLRLHLPPQLCQTNSWRTLSPRESTSGCRRRRALRDGGMDARRLREPVPAIAPGNIVAEVEISSILAAVRPQLFQLKVMCL